MKKLVAALLTAGATIVMPLAIAPASHAEVCGDVGGRHVDVGGCTHVVGDVAAGVALANDDDWAVQEATGQPPCYTPSGVPRTPATEADRGSDVGLLGAWCQLDDLRHDGRVRMRQSDQRYQRVGDIAER